MLKLHFLFAFGSEVRYKPLSLLSTMNQLRVFVRAGRGLREIPAHIEPDMVLQGERVLPGVVLDGVNAPSILGFDMDFLLECIAYAVNEGDERSGEFEAGCGFPVTVHWRIEGMPAEHSRSGLPVRSGV